MRNIRISQKTIDVKKKCKLTPEERREKLNDILLNLVAKDIYGLEDLLVSMSDIVPSILIGIDSSLTKQSVESITDCIDDVSMHICNTLQENETPYLEGVCAMLFIIGNMVKQAEKDSMNQVN